MVLGGVPLLSVVLAFRLACFLPPRFVAKYSQVILRLAQRAHVGFSLLHFNFEAAQAWQLSRSFGAAGAGPRILAEGDSWTREGGCCCSSMIILTI
jgi:hypothetical protein